MNKKSRRELKKLKWTTKSPYAQDCLENEREDRQALREEKRILAKANQDQDPLWPEDHPQRKQPNDLCGT